MGEFQPQLISFFNLVITFLVPAVVWTLLAAGLGQLAYEKLQLIHIRLRAGRRLKPGGYRQPAREGHSAYLSTDSSHL